MKKQLFLPLFVLFSVIVFAQTKTNKAELTIGEEVKESKKMTLDDVVGKDKTGIYVLKRSLRRNKFLLEHYNNKMDRTKTVEVELEKEGKDLDLEGVIDINDELYLLSSFKNNKLKKNYLFIQALNKKTLKPDGQTKKIAEISYDGKWKFNAGDFNYSSSQDESKLLIYYNLPYEKKESEKFGFHVFNNKMEEIWKKEVELPYTDELFGTVNYRVSNTGDVFLLGKLYKEKGERKRRKPIYKYLILAYSDNGNKLNEYPVEIKGTFLTDMMIGINSDKNEITCGGFYSDEGISSIKGCYFLRIDIDSKQIKSKNFKEFGIDFLVQNLSERKEKKVKKRKDKGKDVELPKFNLSDIVLRDDGGAVLIGEQFYITVTTYTTANGMTTSSTHYHYNDIIVINISPQGEIEWAEKISKSQLSTNDGGFYSSYALSVVDDKLYLIYNDNAKNLAVTNRKDKIYTFRRGKNSVVTMVTIDSDGRYVKEALFNADEAEIYTRPKVCRQISDNEMIVFGQKKKKQRFSKVTFKE